MAVSRRGFLANCSSGLISSMLAGSIGCSNRRPTSDQSPWSTLQIVYSHDNSQSYHLMARCKLEKLGSGTATVYSASNFELAVLRYNLGYQKITLLISELFNGHPLECTVVEQPPLWGGMYIPRRDFVFPTARLHISGHLYLILFAFDNTTVFILNNQSSKFEKCHDKTLHEKALGDLWMNSFAPNDVYWSYNLVVNSSFYISSIENAVFQFDKIVDTFDIYNCYNRQKITIAK